MPFDLFRKRLEDVLRADGWVTDGNYGRERDLVWSRANSLIWLDHSLPLVMGRVVSRTLRCCLTREQLWNGNQERFREAFLGRDSIVLWALTTYGRRRREYPVLFRRPEYSHLQVVHLKSPGAARRWLDRQGSTTNA
jgi:hypothetical protein